MKHPNGAYVISITEMWGRCGFLFFASLLVLFMIEVLHFSSEFATILYGVIIGCCFLFQLVTGHLTDLYLGNRKSIIIGSFVMFLSLLVLTYGASLFYISTNTPIHSSFIFNYPEIIFLIGVVLFAIGFSFFKVSVTSFIGLFYKGKEELMDSGYTIYYMLGNLGAFFAPITLHFVVGANNPSLYQYGYLIGAIIIFAGFASFLILKDKYLCLENGEPVGVIPINKTEENNIEELKNKKMDSVEIDRIKVIFIILIISIVLYMSIEQTTTSMVLLSLYYLNNVIPHTDIVLSPEFYVSLNPLFVTIFSLVLIKVTDYLASKNKEPSSITKLSIGTLMGVIAFIFLLIPSYSSGKMSIIWVVLFNLFLVFSEILIGPIIYSLISKLAPVKHASLMIGTGLAATFVSEIMAGYFASVFPVPSTQPDYLFGLIPISNLSSFIWIFITIIGTVLIIWTLSRGKIKKMMHGVE